MNNPFSNPAFIRLGYNPEGFFIELVKTAPAPTQTVIFCGTAHIAASLMKTNNVQHFDFLDSVHNNSDVFAAFSHGARMAGFEF